MDAVVIQQLGIALGLGLLVGLQREWAESQAAGIRTFPLITVFGTVSALLAEKYGGWILGAGVLSLTAMLITVTVIRSRLEEGGQGLTTEAAVLLMYGVGALLVLGHTGAAVITGAGVAVLLHWKKPLHTVVRRMSGPDIRAVIRLVLIALVVLPILPNRTYGPYNVLNPFKIWLMVVLIVGISLGGYIAFRLFGAKAGTVLGGILGGLISSTATTAGYARRSRDAPDSVPLASLVILIASTVAFGRIAVEIGVVAPKVLPRMLPPLAAMMGAMLVLCVVLYLLRRGDAGALPSDDDPSDLKAAIFFGLLYGVIIFAVAAAKQHFGQSGLYIVATVSGLTDMDAITLSTAQLCKADRLALDTGWRMILVAGLSNLCFKMGAVAALGHRRLRKRIALVFGLAILGGVLILALWPKIA